MDLVEDSTEEGRVVQIVVGRTVLEEPVVLLALELVWLMVLGLVLV
jgi:hypothetical protein